MTSPEAVAGGAHEVYSTADDSGSTLKRAAEDEQLYETVDEMQDRVCVCVCVCVCKDVLKYMYINRDVVVTASD